MIRLDAPARHPHVIEVDRNGLEILSREDCVRLLATTSVGRIVISERALPAAFPVNFALLDGDVVFRAGTGSRLAAALDGMIVAFQADDFDPASAAGWSVLIQGEARVLADSADLERANGLGLQDWARDLSAHYVRIRSELLSGRRLRMG